MPTPYLQDVKRIVDSLSRDEEIPIEGRLILLAMMAEHIAEVTGRLEDELT